MALFPTNAAQVQAFAGALYGVQVGSTTMTQVNSDISAAGGLTNALNAYYTASFGNVATATVASSLVANLGISAANAAEATAYVTGVLNSTAANARGAAVMNILNLLSSLTADAKFGADAAAWNTKVETAIAYTGSTNVAIGSVVSATAFTLTTGFDAPNLTAGNNTINGVYGDGVAANTTYTVSDSIVDASTTDSDTLNLLVTGTTAAGVVTVTNIENIALSNTGAGNNTFNAALVTGAKNVKATVTVAGDTQTVSNLASLATSVELAGKGNLTAATTATLTGTADVVALKLSGAGTSSTTRSAVDIGNTNAIEGVTITATGTNFVNLTAGTANKSITVTGDGALTIAGPGAAGFVGDATNSAFTYDAAAATGKQSVTFGAGAITAKGGSADDTFAFAATLGATDTVDAGAGNDTVTFTVGTAVQLNPALTSVETVTADFTAAGTYNASKTTGITTLNLTNSAGSVNEAVTNLAATATALNFKDGATHGTVDISYATGAAAAAVMTLGQQNTTTATGAANVLGNTALTNAGSLTINSVRDVDNTASITNQIGTLNVGTATSLTATTADKAALTVGNLTGTAVTKLTVTADGGAYQQGTLVGGALTDIVLTSANKAGLTTGAIGTANNATTASKLVNYSVTTGATTTVNLGAIDAANLSTSTVAAASALKAVSYNLGSAATVTAIGAIDASDENGAGTNKGSGVAQMDSVAFTLGADAVTNNIAVGAISARSVTAATFTVADQTSAHASGATLNMDESIGSATVTAGKNETFTLTIQGLDDNAGTDLYNLALGTVTGTGAGNVAIAGLSTGLKSISGIDLSGVTGTSEVAASTLSGTSGTTITIGSGGTSATGVSGSDKADIITGGKGADVILGGAGADTITGGLGADTITGGAGQDSIDLTESTSSVDKVYYAHSGAANVDSVTGFKAGTDIVQFTIGNIAGVATDTLSTVAGADVAAAGAAVAATVAANATVTGTTANLLFFSNASATSFATAIGTGTVATTDGNMAGTEGVAAVYFDSLNGQAVFGYILDSSTGTADVLSSADTFVEVTRVGMTSTDFTAANIAASFAFAA